MIVEVSQGKLEGFAQKSVLSGQEYCAFLGIPYAKPPIGKLRFQPPEPAEKWTGTLSAKKEGSPCIQKDFTGAYIGSEDCLYLNVFTPNLPDKNATLKPVMVYIHGGGFQAGAGFQNLYTPDYLMSYDVILVSLNYRLHALGFLNMGTKNCAANCGLRDQNLAFQWIKTNIKQFGGDSENITIFGESAGACCVYLHLISPRSKGLFNRAIILSDPTYGLLRSEWDFQKLGFDLAKKLGSDEKDAEKVVEFLSRQPPIEIVKNIPLLFGSTGDIKDKMGGITPHIFQPSIEKNDENGFLPNTIHNLAKRAAPVPLIIGFNNKEGRLAFAVVGTDILQNLQNDFTSVIPRPPEMNDSEFQKICDKIKKHYFGDEPIGNETVEKAVDLYTDYWYRYFHESFNFVTKSTSPVYVYQFCFHGKFNVFERVMMKDGPVPNSGACHGDILPYLFCPKKFLPHIKEFPEPELTVIKNMCSLWTNFAKYGNPSKNLSNVEWRQFTAEKPCFLHIDKDLKLVEGKLGEKEFQFWLELLEQ